MSTQGYFRLKKLNREVISYPPKGGEEAFPALIGNVIYDSEKDPFGIQSLNEGGYTDIERIILN